MKKKITVSIIGILLVAIVSAGLLDYYGRIEQTLEVTGPVFYLGSGGELLINKLPTCATAGTFNNRDFRVWETDDLGELDFDYIPKADFYVRAKVNVTDRNLILNFSYEDTSSDKYEICSTSVSIITSDLDDYGPISCVGTSAPQNVKKFRYEIIGDCDDCEYQISKCSSGFYTKLEVSAT